MRKVKFEDVATRVNTREDKDNTSLLYYVGGDHIESREMVVHNRGLIEGSTIGPMFYYGFKKGDILLVSRNPHLRKAAVVNFDGICSEKTFVIGTKDEKVLLQRYLAVVVQTDSFWDYCEEHKSGGVNFFVNWSTLAKYEFELPDIEEQRIISDKVWAAYEVKESYRKLISATNEMVKSRFIAWCSEWKSHTTIRDLVDTSVDKASRKFKPEDIIRYIDISSVDGESNSVIGTTEYRFSEAPSRAQQCTRKGDVLVSTVRPNLKNIAVNQLDEDNLVASSGFCVLRPKEQYSGLILAYVLSEPFTQKMVAEAKGSNYPAIHDSDILDYPITVPESHELVRVGEFVQQADKSKYLN